MPAAATAPVFGPSRRLDFEAEIGFIVGVDSVTGERVPASRFREHVFGVCLVNDWSARDIQGWESAPLGPFLGKSFGTTLSAWIVPLAALEQARVRPPSLDTELVDYLANSGDWGFDIDLEVTINGHVVSRPPYSTMFWSPAQMLAHMTVNGAGLRTGDLFASGTVSGPEPDQYGSLIELAWAGRRPLTLGDGSTAKLARRRRRSPHHRHCRWSGRHQSRVRRRPWSDRPRLAAGARAALDRYVVSGSTTTMTITLITRGDTECQGSRSDGASWTVSTSLIRATAPSNCPASSTACSSRPGPPPVIHRTGAVTT